MHEGIGEHETCKPPFGCESSRQNFRLFPDPVAAERLQASLHEAAVPAVEPSDDTSRGPQTERRQLELSRRRVQEALTPAQLDLSQEHVSLPQLAVS